MVNGVVILGAGIAGIAANYYAGKDNAIIYEKDDEYGGVCGNFKLDDFLFDKCIHISFTKNKEVRSIFDKVSYNSFSSNPKSIYNYTWFKHPIQNNMYKLPVDDKVKAIMDFLDKDNIDIKDDTYKSWLYSKYGAYMTEEIFLKYNKKYWCEKAENMETSWIKNRIYTPDLKEILYGAMSENTPSTYYAKEIRYPISGGYKEFLKPMINECNIVLNSKAILIDMKNKIVEFNNGKKVHYNYLINTIPLPELVSITKDINEEIKDKSKSLKNTSVVLVSIVIKGKINFDDIWFYIYDGDILPARAYLPGKKSINNIKDGYSTIQFEIYYSKSKEIGISNEGIMNNIYRFLEKSKLASQKDVILSDIRKLDYANILFGSDTIKNKNYIIEFYEKNHIYSAGRYGLWEYFWSDESLISGKNAVNKINNTLKDKGR
ncbi:MAG: hypothetical protein E7208_11695 [Clostridium butyricum]|nr:hypothetical protein [Clostridium butyricum]